jgi:CDP-glycerol:poly(glycerophosphate) glycerophosphotransferase
VDGALVGKNRIQFAARLFPTLLSLMASVVLVFTSFRAIGLVLAALSIAVIGWRAVTASFSATMPAQLLLTFGVIAAYPLGADGRATTGLAAAGSVLILLVVLQPTAQGILNKPTLRVSHLPTYEAARAIPIDPRILYCADVGGIALLAAAGVAGVSAWPIAALLTLNLVAVAAVTVTSRSARMHNERTVARFHAAMERHDPAFALYFSAPANTEYHVHMWLPYLQRIGTPFVIIVREAKAFANLSTSTSMPVVFCPSVSYVDQAVTPSMRACFYVNNGARNSHMVRFNHMTHIQMLHGDSDKASSFNPVTGMFDRIFVAGQAGIDRYAANGVNIPLRKFDIVGRPQVEDVHVSHDHIRDVAEKIVLYATTWVGLYTDANYCSLSIGEEIVSALLERKATVILRPHPYVGRDAASARHLARLIELLAEDRAKTGRPHIFGPAATTAMSVFDCVNKADALISDVSGVASDFLFSGKPFALTNMLGESAEEFETSFPLARAAYIVDRGAENLDAVLDDLFEADPLETTRLEVKTYYLGDFGEANYSDVFVNIARAYVVERFESAAAMAPPELAPTGLAPTGLATGLAPTGLAPTGFGAPGFVTTDVATTGAAPSGTGPPGLAPTGLA